MERKVYFEPAYDKRDPDPNKNYGIHGASIRFVLKGDKGAVQFLIYTNWYLPNVQKELKRKYAGKTDSLFFFTPMPADVGYHSLEPTYSGQECITQECEYLDGKPCYYDGSTTRAERVFDILVAEGDEAVWKCLEDYYHKTFGTDVKDCWISE